MTLVNAIKKIEKAGFKVEQVNSVYRASKSTTNYVIEFFKNGCSGNITCINVRRLNDEHDSMTDYYAGVWANNITQAIKLASS